MPQLNNWPSELPLFNKVGGSGTYLECGGMTVTIYSGRFILLMKENK